MNCIMQGTLKLLWRITATGKDRCCIVADGNHIEARPRRGQKGLPRARK